MLITDQAQARNTVHKEGVSFLCSVCGETKPVRTQGGTGYGYAKDSKIVCYDCCGEGDRADMVESGKATLYFTPDKSASYNKCTISNWPDSLKFTGAFSVGLHNIAGKRYDVRFKGPDGFWWHGVTYGNNTQICHCKRTKRKVNQ